jgi:DNA-binding SARP family transcriptional activator
LFERGRLDAKAGRHEQASESFAAALGLWRGPALGNLRDGPMLGAFATWVEEARLQCLELMIESNLALGLHREMIGQLYSLAGEHPLRETFYGQLMLALYRAERQADALAAYRSARETLHDQLGTEPGRALSAMQRAILRTDNRLDLREPSPAADRKRTVNVR